MEELAAALAAARQRLLRKEEAWAVERGRLHARVVALEDEVGEERGARVKAEAAVQGLPSVEEVESTKGQLRALMQLLHEEGNAEEGEGEVGGSVEGVLLGRVKRLESELVAARRRVEEAEAACAGMQGTCAWGCF